ncbi:D-xylose ABC transporter ATP-binding protein [Paracoccus thiocyanatus]|uniref:D-xylose ABC transporter ATP-binding protein n=1 Tax=Paracoccus thiocyanatus TaxID=34006 RepID=A0A3D8PF85_9RHOB|nr:D-xylose ABC transporter ATP-binding protein [Paracoccus thiocyanatus]
MADSILEMRGISKGYPGVQALSGVDLSVGRGEVHGLMGENGAGKSTLIKILAGAITPDEGTIRFDGTEVATLDPRRAMELGIGVIYQELNLVPNMTVADNIYLGVPLGRGPWRNPKTANAKAVQLLKSLGIDVDPTAQVSELTIAYQQMVEIAKAVSKNVKLLVMDEPTAPLSSHEVERLFALIDRLRADNISIIYISHRMEEIFKLTERVTVLRDGRFITTLDSATTTRPELIRAMVGRELSETYPHGSHAQDGIVLEARKISGNRFIDVSFSLRKGEILGIGGLVGAGRTEMARALFGADPLHSGEIAVNGETVRITSPVDGLRAGIALVPEDRKHQGLHLSMSVRDNISLASLKALTKGGWISLAKEADRSAQRIADLRIKTPHAEQIAGTLSGGNQQKVVIAKWLETKPQILIMDEPTRGIDVGAKHEIYVLMKDLAAQGYSIIMISSDMPELLGVSDRILVMRRGRISGELPRAEASQERVLDLAAH